MYILLEFNGFGGPAACRAVKGAVVDAKWVVEVDGGGFVVDGGEACVGDV